MSDNLFPTELPFEGIWHEEAAAYLDPDNDHAPEYNPYGWLRGALAERDQLRAELERIKADAAPRIASLMLQLAQAKAERDALHRDRDHNDALMRAEAQLAAARVEIERLRAGLEKHGHHTHGMLAVMSNEGCAAWYSTGPCTCGLEDLIARAAIEPITPGVGT